VASIKEFATRQGSGIKGQVGSWSVLHALKTNALMNGDGSERPFVCHFQLSSTLTHTMAIDFWTGWVAIIKPLAEGLNFNGGTCLSF